MKKSRLFLAALALSMATTACGVSVTSPELVIDPGGNHGAPIDPGGNHWETLGEGGRQSTAHGAHTAQDLRQLGRREPRLDRGRFGRGAIRGRGGLGLLQIPE